MNKKLSQQQLAKYIAIISLVLWLVSLGLVGFVFSNKSWHGTDILLSGLLFGWARLGFLTVYSNIFHIFAAIKLLQKQKPKKTVICMIVLAVLLVPTIINNNVNMNFDTSVPRLPFSWGWGAILLLFTQSLIVISALLAHQKISVKLSSMLIGFLMIPIIGVGAFSAYQRSQANEWEMEHYFPSYDVAFTKQPLSGLPYKALTEKLPNDAMIEIEFIDNVSPVIEEDEDAYPNAYWQNGKFWKKYYGDIFRNFAINTEKSSTPTYYLAITNPKSQYYLYTLYKHNNNEILYQQPFRVVKNDEGLDYYIRPSLYELPDEIINIDKNRQKKQPLWQSEKGQEQCTVKKIVTDNLNEIWQLDEHQLRILDYNRYKGIVDSGFYPNHSLCSANYILAFHYDKEEKSADINAWLFERETGFPVAKFNYYNDYKNPRKFTETIFNQFELVTIEKQKNEEDKSYIILYSDKGDVRLSLREKEQKIYR